MIAGETEDILEQDFEMDYDPDTLDDPLYDDFIFGSKEKRAERRAKSQERKRKNKLRRQARKNDRRRRRQRGGQGFLASVGGVGGIGAAIDALISKPEPPMGTAPAESDYQISVGTTDNEPEKEDRATMTYIIIGGVALVSVIGVAAILKNQKNNG